MVNFHKNLSQEKWNSFSKTTQLLNIASELNRFKKWSLDENEMNRNNSLDRAVELLELTINDKRWHKNQFLKELLRLKEVLVSHYLPKQHQIASPKQILQALLYLNPETALVGV